MRSQPLRRLETEEIETFHRDDAAELLHALEIPSAIAVGYSMGGPVSKPLWRRHAELVDGRVLCATSHRPINTHRVGRAAFSGAMAVGAETARIGQATAVLSRMLRRSLVNWIYGEDWLEHIDAPTSVVVTLQDRAIRAEDPMQLALGIPGARVFCVDLGHAACADPLFDERLLAACRDVATRAGVTPAPVRPARVSRWLRARVDALLA